MSDQLLGDLNGYGQKVLSLAAVWRTSVRDNLLPSNLNFHQFKFLQGQQGRQQLVLKCALLQPMLAKVTLVVTLCMLRRKPASKRQI